MVKNGDRKNRDSKRGWEEGKELRGRGGTEDGKEGRTEKDEKNKKRNRHLNAPKGIGIGLGTMDQKWVGEWAWNN